MKVISEGTFWVHGPSIIARFLIQQHARPVSMVHQDSLVRHAADLQVAQQLPQQQVLHCPRLLMRPQVPVCLAQPPHLLAQQQRPWPCASQRALFCP